MTSGSCPPPDRSSRARRGPTSALPVLVVAVLSIVLSAMAGCSWFRQVDLGVEGVRAEWSEDLGPGDRRVLVVTPDAEPPAGGWPMVVVLHGLGSDPVFTARITGWADAASRHGLVALFPEGTDMSWNAGSCCGQAALDGTDDVAFLRGVVEDAEARLPVDAARAYMVGWSNGGMMTYRFLCTDADLLAGAGSVAGTDTADCSPSTPVSFLQVSGVLDDVVPPAGGASSQPNLGSFPPVLASVQRVADAADCARPTSSSLGPVRVTNWSPCAEGATVRYDLVDGLDHGWFLAGVYTTTDQYVRFWGLG